MTEPLTSSEYQALKGKNKRQVRVDSGASGPGKVDHASQVRDRLRAMGEYFGLDPKSVKFYIRQLELSKVI